MLMSLRPLMPLKGLLANQPSLLEQLRQRFDLRFDERDPRDLVPLEVVEQALLLIAQSGRPAISYELAAELEIGSFGVLDYYLHACETVGEALTELFKYHEIVTRDYGPLPTRLSIQGDELIAENVLAPDAFPLAASRLRYALMVGCFIRYVQLLADDNTLLPTHSESPMAPFLPLSEHAKVFGNNMVWQAKRSAVFYPATLFHRRLRNANPRLRKLLEQEVKAEFNRFAASETLAQQVLNGIAVIGFSRVSQGAIADRMGVSESTLKRRLADEELTFMGLLNTCRREEALRLLAETEDKVDAVAAVLGFSERATFERAFRQWLEMSPAQFRRETRISLFSGKPIDPNIVRELPMLTNVAQQILAVARDESAGARKIAAMVRKDPVLSARLLALANSPMYGAGRVNSLEDAITRYLGVNVVRNLALTMMAVSVLDTSACRQFDVRRFWVCALATSSMAGLALKYKLLEGADKDRIETMALLHNLGVLLMVANRPQDMERLLPLLDECDSHDDALNLERKALGVSRYQAGYHLLLHWKLPAELANMVRALDPSQPVADRPMERKETVLVRLCAAFVSDCLGNRGDHDYLGRWADQASTEFTAPPAEFHQLAILTLASLPMFLAEANNLIPARYGNPGA